MYVALEIKNVLLVWPSIALCPKVWVGGCACTACKYKWLTIGNNHWVRAVWRQFSILRYVQIFGMPACWMVLVHACMCHCTLELGKVLHFNFLLPLCPSLPIFFSCECPSISISIFYLASFTVFVGLCPGITGSLMLLILIFNVEASPCPCAFALLICLCLCVTGHLSSSVMKCHKCKSIGNQARVLRFLGLW